MFVLSHKGFFLSTKKFGLVARGLSRISLDGNPLSRGSPPLHYKKQSNKAEKNDHIYNQK